MLLQLALHGASGIDNSGTVNIAAGQGIFILGRSDSLHASRPGRPAWRRRRDAERPAVILSGGSFTGSGTVCGPGGNQAAPCGVRQHRTELTNGGKSRRGRRRRRSRSTAATRRSSTGTLAVGIDNSGNDQLAVSGSGNTAALDGTLQVTTASGTNQTVGQAYQVLTAPRRLRAVRHHHGTGPYTSATTRRTSP